MGKTCRFTCLFMIFASAFLQAQNEDILLEDLGKIKNKLHILEIERLKKDKSSQKKEIEELKEKNRLLIEKIKKIENIQIGWNGNKGYFNFTLPSWMKMSAEEQMEKANIYQAWYAKRMGVLRLLSDD